MKKSPIDSDSLRRRRRDVPRGRDERVERVGDTVDCGL